MKNHLPRILAVLLVLAWMTLIFGFSAQSGEESGGLSALIAKPITLLIASLRRIEMTDELYSGLTVLSVLPHISPNMQSLAR